MHVFHRIFMWRQMHIANFETNMLIHRSKSCKICQLFGRILYAAHSIVIPPSNFFFRVELPWLPRPEGGFLPWRLSEIWLFKEQRYLVLCRQNNFQFLSMISKIMDRSKQTEVGSAFEPISFELWLWSGVIKDYQFEYSLAKLLHDLFLYWACLHLTVYYFRALQQSLCADDG